MIKNGQNLPEIGGEPHVLLISSCRLCFITNDNIGRACVQIMQKRDKFTRTKTTLAVKIDRRVIFATNVQKNIAVSSSKNSQTFNLHVIVLNKTGESTSSSTQICLVLVQVTACYNKEIKLFHKPYFILNAVN